MQSALSGLNVIVMAPIVDFFLEKTGDDQNKITLFFWEIIKYFGIDSSLLVLFVISSVLMFLMGGVSVVARYVVLKIKYIVLEYLLESTMSDLFKARYVFFSQEDIGKLLNTFQKEVNDLGDTFGHIATSLAQIAQAIIFIIIPFIVDWKMTMMFIITTAILMLPLTYVHKYSYAYGKDNTITANRSAGILHEILTSVKLILAFGHRVDSVEKYIGSYRDHAKATIKFQTLNTGVYAFFLPIGFTAALISVYISYINNVAFSDIVIILFAFVRLMPIVGQVLSVKSSLHGFIPAYEQIRDLKNNALLFKERSGGEKDLKFNAEFQIKNLSFSYPDGCKALNNVSMRIKKGAMIAIVGRSGSGKSTLADIILGLHFPSDGNVLVDGVSLYSYNIEDWRERIGYVPQEAQLFSMSIRDNIVWGEESACDKDIDSVIDESHCDEFIRRLSNGKDTMLGYRGERLSGGQKQRIALARALLRRPDILVLDEATSSLDGYSEKLIQESLYDISKNTTIIIIAHRLSTIRKADYIYVLDEGEVVEEGTYYQLFENDNSNLSKMIAVQQS